MIGEQTIKINLDLFDEAQLTVAFTAMLTAIVTIRNVPEYAAYLEVVKKTLPIVKQCLLSMIGVIEMKRLETLVICNYVEFSQMDASQRADTISGSLSTFYDE